MQKNWLYTEDFLLNLLYSNRPYRAESRRKKTPSVPSAHWSFIFIGLFVLTAVVLTISSLIFFFNTASSYQSIATFVLIANRDRLPSFHITNIGRRQNLAWTHAQILLVFQKVIQKTWTARRPKTFWNLVILSTVCSGMPMRKIRCLAMLWELNNKTFQYTFNCCLNSYVHGATRETCLLTPGFWADNQKIEGSREGGKTDYLKV